jgi:hypothetical protein
MGCSFSIDFPNTAQQLVEMAESSVVSAGGKFEGNEKEGEFCIHTPMGKVKGYYQIDNNSIIINIKEKPMLVGCNRIENELRRYLIKQTA